MNKAMRMLAMILLTCLIGSSSFASDLEDGEKAVNSGEYTKALKLLAPLAEAGEPKAQRLLGVIYDNGAGEVKVDSEKAKYWLKKASDGGDEIGTFNLSLTYMNQVSLIIQEPTKAECDEALPYLLAHQSAVYGSVYEALGQLYEWGRCVERDGNEAIRYYKLAVASKRPLKSDESVTAEISRQMKPQELAALGLSLMYRDGLTVTQNYKLAHVWANIAVTFGADHSLRDKISEKMTVSQISDAQSIAERCVKSNYVNCE